MTDLRSVLGPHVDNGTVPGAVALISRGDEVEAAAVGVATIGCPEVTRDSIFRFASITKPITAAALMMLVEEGRLSLDDPVSMWLPELANPAVVRTPTSSIDDVVPLVRPITVFDVPTTPRRHIERSARCSWRARAGVSARRSTSCQPSRGTYPAGTAGSAAPVRPRTSCRRPGRSRSC
jgi:hypothetical protein